MLFKKIKFTLYERDLKWNPSQVGDKRTEFTPATGEDILMELVSILGEHMVKAGKLILERDDNSELEKKGKGGKRQMSEGLSKDANADSRKPATTGDVSKVIRAISERTKELNMIISEVNSELVGSAMEVQEEKDLAKKASEGWLEDSHGTLCEIRGQLNRVLEKMQLLKSRLKTGG